VSPYWGRRVEIKIVVTRCQILMVKFSKFGVGWGSAPDPLWELTALPLNPLAGFRGPTCKGKRGKGRG